jgi:hypothetical protein
MIEFSASAHNTCHTILYTPRDELDYLFVHLGAGRYKRPGVGRVDVRFRECGLHIRSLVLTRCSSEILS